MPSLQQIREKIIEDALDEIVFQGWDFKVILEACQNSGYEKDYARILFPQGIEQVLDCYLCMMDHKMLSEIEQLPLDGLPIREKITQMVATRIALLSSKRSLAIQTMTTLSMPIYAKLSSKALFRSADHMWRAIGDQSTDHNYYSKRMLLSMVYASTLLYWVNDDSEQQKDTYEFLKRRIQNVMSFGKITHQLSPKRCSEKLGSIPFLRLIPGIFSSIRS